MILYWTYHAATGEHDSKPVDDARRADNPRQPNEQNYSEDVLHARQVNADQRAHSGRSLFGSGRLGVGLRQIWDGVRVVGDRVEESGHSRPVIHFILQSVRHIMIRARNIVGNHNVVINHYIYILPWFSR